jgi:hypothetical protein
MTSIKICSAAFITVAMLTTSVEARGVVAPERHIAHHHEIVAPDHWLFSQGRMPASSSLFPQDRAGAVCDHGDDPEIC